LGQIKICSIVKEVESKFDSDVKIKGLEDKFLSYHFKNFPAIALQLSTWQNDINKAESDVYSSVR
jgi:hypothetical protein